MAKSTAVTVLVLALAVVSGPCIRSKVREAHLKRRVADFAQRLALHKEHTASQSRSNPIGARERATAHIAQEFTVGPGKIQSFQFTPSHVPGTLIGTWRASGEGLGGVDNSLASFRLTDPSNTPLATSPRESDGKFVVKISETGAYTFYFDNAGLSRTTPRRVLLEADFFAD